MFKKNYTVFVDDNFHYMDANERYKKGKYKTLEEAISVCEKIVDENLEELYAPEMSSRELMTRYCLFGEDPWISGAEKIPFHARNYAEERIDQLINKKI